MNGHPHDLHDAIEQSVRKAAGENFRLPPAALGNGNRVLHTLTVETGENRFFIKAGGRNAREHLSAETDGLSALQATKTFRMPQVIAFDGDDRQAVLILEHLDLHPVGTPEEGIRFAKTLIDLHRHTGNEFGWHRHNFIGMTPQDTIRCSRTGHAFSSNAA